MWNTTIKGLRAHWLRLVLTGLAVVLGVGFVSGTLMLTDTMRAAFSDVMTQTAGGIDVQVRGESAFATQTFGDEREPLQPELLDTVRTLPAVGFADPVVSGYAQLIRPDGEPIGGMGPPTLGANAPSREGLGGVNLAEGRFPVQSGEIAIDAYTSETHGLAVGDEVQLVTSAGPEHAQVVGVVRFGEASNMAGATITLFDYDTARDRLTDDGLFSTIDVLAADGVSAERLAEDVRAVVGDDVEVLTSQELIDEGMEAIGGFLDVFSTALLVFAAVSLFVGAFIIFNTFSIIVAQRTREFALLRAVGASRRQVLTSMLTEAAVTGLVASLLGVGVGAGLAMALRALLAAFGVELPMEGLVLLARTPIIAVVLGVAVTVLAALVPVLRSTRVPPVAALQTVAAPPAPRPGASRYVIGGVVTAAGLAGLAAGLFGDAGLSVIGGGAVGVFLGFTILSPLVARPLVRVIGAPVARTRGVQGQLARENAMRNPRRTASTAAALMIGLGLVGFVTIFAASLKASASSAVDELFAADLQARSATFSDLPPGIVDEVEALPEIRLAGTQTLVEARIRERTTFLMGMDPTTMDELFRFTFEEGSAASLEQGGLLASGAVARAEGWSIGDEVTVEFARTGQTPLVLRGIFDGAGHDVQFIVDDQTYAAHVRSPNIFAVLMRYADGVSPEEGRAAVEAALADYPTAQLTDQEGFREEINASINQLLGLVFGLLALSVVVALFGIVNTLALSVFERVRELGLLRAIGMTRRQVRAMVRWEALLIAVLGAVLGLVIGVLFAWLLGQALADQGLGRFVIPGGQLAAAVVVAALAGVLAGVLPARRAARVDVLRAVTTE